MFGGLSSALNNPCIRLTASSNIIVLFRSYSAALYHDLILNTKNVMFARLQTTNKSMMQVKLKKLRKHYREPYCYREWKPLVGKPALSLGHLRSVLMTEYLCSWNLLRLILLWENRYDLSFQSSILWCFKFHIRWLKIYEVIFAIWLLFFLFSSSNLWSYC